MDAHERTIIPMLTYEDAAAAIPWLERVFGFRERPDQRVTNDDRIAHAELTHEGGSIMLTSTPTGYQAPRRHREACSIAAAASAVPWVIDGVQVRVADRDAHLAQARAEGAIVLGEPSDEPYGRLYRAEDLEGHRWMFLEPPAAGAGMASARGGFTVTDWSEETEADRATGRRTRAVVRAALDGDLTGTAEVTWLMCYRQDGTAEFTGLVDIDGTLAGRRGGFVVVSTGSFDGRVARGPWRIADGSGRGDLAGIAGDGSFDSTHDGATRYRLTYHLAGG